MSISIHGIEHPFVVVKRQDTRERGGKRGDGRKKRNERNTASPLFSVSPFSFSEDRRKEKGRRKGKKKKKGRKQGTPAPRSCANCSREFWTSGGEVRKKMRKKEWGKRKKKKGKAPHCCALRCNTLRFATGWPGHDFVLGEEKKIEKKTGREGGKGKKKKAGAPLSP